MSVGAVYVARSRVLARVRRQIATLGDGEAFINEADHEDPIGPL
jgi:hypothetical protein